MARLLLNRYPVGIVNPDYQNENTEINSYLDIYYDQTEADDFCTILYCEWIIEGWTYNTASNVSARISKNANVTIFDNDNSGKSYISLKPDTSSDYRSYRFGSANSEGKKTLHEVVASGTYSRDSVAKTAGIPHNADGTKTIKVGATSAAVEVYATAVGNVIAKLDNRSDRFLVDLPPYERAAKITTARNFSDEENAEFTYIAPISYSVSTITSIQACLSLDGETTHIPYRNIPLTSSTYTFVFTEEEREFFRKTVSGSPTASIYYITKTEFTDGTDDYVAYDIVERIITIAGCNPQLNPTVKDVNARTVYLTGNENKFVKYGSIAQFNIGATASKYATIVSQYVTNGAQTIYNTPTGTIEGIESNTFYFSATDSRDLTARDAIVVDLVPYVKLTAAMTDVHLGTDGKLTFTVSGNYFNGSFGAVNNSLEIEYGIRENDGDISWKIINPTITFNDNSYSFTYSISGLDYLSKYTITVNVIDELTSIQTTPKVVTAIPVFDWSEKQFRHNTDINFANNKVLYGTKADGTLISAFEPCTTGGNLQIGLGGYNTESGNTNIFGNTIKLDSKSNVRILAPTGFSVNGTKLDYIVEQKSSGGWFYRKWSGGRVELYGYLTVTNVACNTALGGMYRTAVISSPDFPISVTNPKVVASYESDGYGAFLWFTTAADSSAPGDFYLVRPTSTTIGTGTINYFVQGTWS